MSHEDTLTHAGLVTEVLSDGITRHRFFRHLNWEHAYAGGTLVHAVLSHMKDRGVYSLIKVERAKTHATGPIAGVATALEIVGNERGPLVAVNGGFFIHYPRLFLDIEKGGLLSDSHLYLPVGRTTLTDRYVPVPPAYEEELRFREMGDGSGFTVGPSLGQPLAVTAPSFTKVNSLLGRFHYFARNSWGEKIRSPLWESFANWDKQYEDFLAREGTTTTVKIEKEGLTAAGKFEFRKDDNSVQYAANAPENEYIRSYWARLPGNLSHAMEPNERSGVSRHDGTWLFHAYTCARPDGLTINEFRQVVRAGASFLGFSLDTIPNDHAWANDGDPSIFQLFVGKDGNRRLLARGGDDDQKEYLEINTEKMRQVPNAIVARAGSRGGVI